MNRFAIGLCVLLIATSLASAQTGRMAPALVFEDQFERQASVADLRGTVVILVYGDRKGTYACRALGEQLHIAFHPTAKGLPASKAQNAPVMAVPGLPEGQLGPDVCVIPVACCGKVPGPVKGFIRTQIAKGSPDVVVWLDFNNTMKDAFSLKAGEANVVVLDTNGRPRQILNGNPDADTVAKVIRDVQTMRAEAVK